MNSNIVHAVCTNMRDPLDAKKRVHLTPRAIKMICLLFNGKDIDVINLHSILLRVAYMKGSFDSKRHVTMSDVITYILTTNLIAEDDVRKIAETFDISKDSIHGEVRDMKNILGSIRRE